MDAPEHVYTIFIRTRPGDLWEALTTAGPMLRYFDERPVTT